MSVILYSIPAFFILIGVELLVSRLLRRSDYRLNDAVNDLSCGILSEVVGLFTKVVTLGLYAWLYAHFAVWHVPAESVVGWIALFLLVDHQYYWFHRWAHRANGPWAAHIVHHQSEDLNLAVALRQSSFQRLFSFWFYLPLAFIGFHPLAYATMGAINTVAQFWIHTRLLKRLGPIEWVLNTPSHHRVHHGKNPEYIDKNYGGALIIFDRMYGTFEPEVAEPVYGITEPLNNWNPVWANFKTWRDIARSVRDASWIDRVKVWFMPPEWVPAGRPAKPPHPALDARTYVKYDPKLPPGVGLYLFLHFVAAIGVTLWLLILAPKLAAPPMVATSAYVVFSMMGIGAMFDRQSWALRLEPLRLAGLVAFAGLATRGTAAFVPVTAAAAVIAVASLVVLARQRDRLPAAA